MRDAPAPHPGLLFFACPKKSNQKKGQPGWRDYSRASAVPGPGADLRGILPRRSGADILSAPPSGCSPGTLRCAGAPYGDPKKTTHLRSVLLVPFGVLRALGARFKLIADSLFSPRLCASAVKPSFLPI